MTIYLSTLLAGALALGFGATIASAADIVDTAVAGKFNTLVAAVKAAGLVDILKGPGPFTVFAPTDEAFAKLPAGTLETLLQPENKAKLRSILYHVVPGRVMAEEVVKLDSAETAEGQGVAIKVVSGNPNHSGLPTWRPFEPGPRATMVFDTDCQALDDPHREERLVVKAVLDSHPRAPA